MSNELDTQLYKRLSKPKEATVPFPGQSLRQEVFEC